MTDPTIKRSYLSDQETIVFTADKSGNKVKAASLRFGPDSPLGIGPGEVMEITLSDTGQALIVLRQLPSPEAEADPLTYVNDEAD